MNFKVSDLEVSKKKVAALTEPRNAVLVGASDRPGSWAARVWRNIKHYEFPKPAYLINPRRNEIFGERCYPDLQALPEPPDHLVVLVPAPAVARIAACRRQGRRPQRHGVLLGLRRGVRQQCGGAGPRARRGHRRDRPCGFGPELHGQHLRQEPLRHAERRSAADAAAGAGGAGRAERRDDDLHQCRRWKSAA